MVKAYFTACEQAFPAKRTQLRRLSLALRRGGVEGMAQNTAANAVLTADIDLGGSKWTPIAPSATFKNDATSVEETTDKSYSGTFDGQGHTISNFEIRTNSAEKTSGLFGTVTAAVVEPGHCRCQLRQRRRLRRPVRRPVRFAGEGR